MSNSNKTLVTKAMCLTLTTVKFTWLTINDIL